MAYTTQYWNPGSPGGRGGTGGFGGSGGAGSGGGLYVAGGAVTLNNDTLSSNHANGGSFGSGGPGGPGGAGSPYGSTGAAGPIGIGGAGIGGGIYVGSGSVTLHNTLISGNAGGDVSGTLDSASDYSLIGDGSGGLSTANHNLLGVNPLLAPLGNYGGPTQTMDLLPGNPAIDQGSNAYVTSGETDQRGLPRIVGSSVDIGAVESQGFAFAISSGNNQRTVLNTAFANPLQTLVAENGYGLPGVPVTFTAPGSGASAGFTSPATTVTDATGHASVTAAANTIPGTYTVSASASGVASPANFSLGNATLIMVTTLSDDNNSNDGTTSLREAISYAETLSVPSFITFDPSILTKASGNVVDLLSALPDLTGDITIEGPGAKVLTVQRDASAAAFSVFTVDSGATAAISGLTISGGSAPEGGGIDNGGSLTLSNSILSGNSATDGGGISNDGTLTVNDSTLSGNTASDGGGIWDNGTATVSDSTLSGNSAGVGGGIANGGSLTVSGSILSGNTATVGGGISNNGSLTVSDSTLTGDSAVEGGAIANGGTLSVNDSTLSGDIAANDGGGIANKGSLTVSDSTLSANTASIGGGIYNDSSDPATLSNASLADNSASTAGGGIDVVSGSVLTHSTLVAGNLAGSKPSDVSGSLDSASDYSLIGDGSGGLSTANHNLLGSSASPLDPLLAPLGNYGGPTQTLALLPGSPAIDAGSSAYGGSTDQRGEARVGATDIGAFESQGFSIAVSSGNNQSAIVNTAFADPLVVSVTANNSVEPVAGGRVTFTAPASGALAILSASPATIGSDGKASVTATANAIFGTYTVSATASGITSPANFSLGNSEIPSLVVTMLSDENNPFDGTTSLREAIAYADTLSGPQTITLDPSILTKASGNVIDLLSALPDLTGNIAIEGPGANVLTVQRDARAAAFSVFTVDAGATAAISGLTISGGSAIEGGGIANVGSLTVSDSTLSGNSSSGSGGGILNIGILTVSDSTLSGNTARGDGGGIYNSGTLTVIASNLSGNSANGPGGGIANGVSSTELGKATVIDSTLSSNYGGGINNAGGTVTVSGSTLSGNSGVGINNASGTVTVRGSTLSGNFGRGIENSGGYTTFGILNVVNMTVSDSTLSNNSGGGIYTNVGSMTVSDSTLSGNSGVGIHNGGYKASLTVINSTLSDNSGDGIDNQSTVTVINSTLSDNSGDGIDIFGGDVLLHNTLIAGNLSGGSPSDISGSLDKASDYNLIGDGSGGLSKANHNVLGTSANPLNPLLLPLGNYGGPTQTMALFPGGPAIDAGSSAYGGSTDQRGEPRVGATDIGAFERQGKTYVVTSAADDGSAGTLRDAINQANAGKYDEIDFKIGTSRSAQTINLTSQLPTLTASEVFINGLSQAGSGNTTQLITLDGTKAGSSSDGLLLQGSIDIVSGLMIQHFGNNGIEVEGDNNTIGGSTQGARNIVSGNSKDGVLIDSGSSGNQVLGNFLGLKNTGYSALANGSNGLEVEGSNNTIGGNSGSNYYTRNFISGNGNDGLLIDNSASGNQVQGNFIGLDISGTKGAANAVNGIEIAGNSNSIGGTVLGVGNAVSGNKNDGILLDSTASDNLIQDTDVGTDYAGQAAVANGGNGIEIMGNGNTLGDNPFAPRNIIAGNSLDGVRIDSGASGTLIEGNFIGLNSIDAAVPNAGNGINLAGTNNTLGGNIISGNSNDGVLLASSASGNLVLGNYLGVNFFGNAAANSNGIEVAGTQNTIGGSAFGASNVISGNTNDGVLLDSTASGNLVLGNSVGVSNSVGLSVSGNFAVGNGNGIEVAGHNNTVGALYAVAPNVISGNSNDGVLLDSIASGNQVLGNYIGTNYAGRVASANQVGIEDAGSGNTIGGSVNGARNLISGNSGDGVLLDSTAAGEILQGNIIGLDGSGRAALANGSNGIEVQGTNLIGGDSASNYFTRNFLSGNGNDGLLIDGSGSGNRVQGNFIGVDVSGTNGVGNAANGIEIGGSSNTIGGTPVGLGNVISGNQHDGILLGGTASSNAIQGNDIGTDYTGENAVANSAQGVEILGAGNTLGGTVSGARNIISGNAKDGVLLDSSGSGTLIQGNYVGINLSSVALPNASNGIEIASSQNTVGGTTSAARNILSGNKADGLKLDSSASGNVVLGNFIGVNVFSNAAANNNGIEVAGTQNTVGGSASGSFNVISGNKNDGVLLDGTASGNVVLGNSVGLNVYGNIAVGNSNGIEVAGAHNTVGASYAVAPNVISGNSKDGVRIDSGASGNVVLGNYIGTNHAGTAVMANQVGIEDAGSGNTIGGSVLGARNVISGNSGDGVLLDSSATGETVQGNYVGLNYNGKTALANGSNGVEVQGSNNLIGGNSGSNYFTRNFISGNTGDGLLIANGATGNLAVQRYK